MSLTLVVGRITRAAEKGAPWRLYLTVISFSHTVGSRAIQFRQAGDGCSRTLPTRKFTTLPTRIFRPLMLLFVP
jgi:hypothetical protein